MLQEHVNHDSNDGRSSGKFVVLIWRCPLELERIEPLGNDQDIHPSEENVQENNLRNEFEDEVHWLSEVDSVDTFHADTERHLEYSQDNCNLHFDTVGNVQIVVTLLPSGIKSNSVDAILSNSVVTNSTVGITRIVRVDALSVTRVEEFNRH